MSTAGVVGLTGLLARLPLHKQLRVLKLGPPTDARESIIPGAPTAPLPGQQQQPEAAAAGSGAVLEASPLRPVEAGGRGGNEATEAPGGSGGGGAGAGPGAGGDSLLPQPQSGWQLAGMEGRLHGHLMKLEELQVGVLRLEIVLGEWGSGVVMTEPCGCAHRCDTLCGTQELTTHAARPCTHPHGYTLNSINRGAAQAAAAWVCCIPLYPPVSCILAPCGTLNLGRPPAAGAGGPWRHMGAGQRHAGRPGRQASATGGGQSPAPVPCCYAHGLLQVCRILLNVLCTCL